MDATEQLQARRLRRRLNNGRDLGTNKPDGKARYIAWLKFEAECYKRCEALGERHDELWRLLSSLLFEGKWTHHTRGEIEEALRLEEGAGTALSDTDLAKLIIEAKGIYTR